MWPGSRAKRCQRLGRSRHFLRCPAAWVKHAAQGSALLADALAGGQFAALAASLELRSATGSIWDVVNRQPDIMDYFFE